MSVRFKFRSSVNFDSVDIEGRSSISIRDLRSKIVRQKNLNICQDFDLVFSDALTGREYNDENFPIPSGSSVIIKRVPAGMLASAPAVVDSVENFRMKDSRPLSPMHGQMVDFDDFGIDLCPAPEAMLAESDQEFSKKNGVSNEKANIAASRLECQKLEVSDLSEAIPRDSCHSGNERNIPQKKLEPKVEEHMKLEKAIGTNYSAVQNADLPSELKCPLCNAFFKEAVMIPCCQLSFCEKCIHVVLIDKGRCPKCFSSKCRVKDLLPNLSLRQAIERFLETQMLMTDNALHEYAPDGESGIQALDVSCAVTIGQKELDLPHSSSATEKGSNQIMGGFFPESRIRKNASLECKALKLASSSHKVKQVDGEIQSGLEDLAAVADFQGENQPLNLPRARVHETADSTVRKQSGLWVDNGGGGRSFMATGRHRMQGDRTCYMCGSPDHLIRDCPIGSTHHPMLQTGNPMFPGGMIPGGMPGYASPYWNGASFAPMRPFTNMYGHPGMMPFNPAMLPVSSYAVPPYISSMYGGPPPPGGIMRMGGLAPPVGIRAERPVSHSELLELQECENRGKAFDENLGRRRPYDDQDDFHQRHHYNEPERSHERKSRTEREKSVSHSGDSHSRIPRRKHQHDKHLDHEVQPVDDRHGKSSRSSGRDRRPHLSERSSSGVEDMSNSCERYGDDRNEKHHVSSKRHHDRRGQCGSDSSRSRHHSRKEKDAQQRVDTVPKASNRKRHSHSESGLEPSSSCDQEKKYKDKDHVRGSGHSRDSVKPVGDELRSDRWQMVSRPDEDSGEGYRHHKRKRIY